MDTITRYKDNLLPVWGLPRLFENLCQPSQYSQYSANFRGLPKAWHSSSPPVNVQELDQSFRMEFSVPGWKKEDFHIEFKQHTLKVWADKQVDQKDQKNEKDQKDHYLHQEWAQKSFSHSIELPDMPYKSEKVTAQYQNGILQIEIPKPEAKLVNAHKVLVA